MYLLYDEIITKRQKWREEKKKSNVVIEARRQSFWEKTEDVRRSTSRGSAVIERKFPHLIFVSGQMTSCLSYPCKTKKLWKWHRTLNVFFYIFITAIFIDKYGFILIKSPSNCDEGWYLRTASLLLTYWWLQPAMNTGKKQRRDLIWLLMFFNDNFTDTQRKK